jgi:hypothetical protein
MDEVEVGGRRLPEGARAQAEQLLEPTRPLDLAGAKVPVPGAEAAGSQRQVEPGAALLDLGGGASFERDVGQVAADAEERAVGAGHRVGADHVVASRLGIVRRLVELVTGQRLTGLEHRPERLGEPVRQAGDDLLERLTDAVQRRLAAELEERPVGLHEAQFLVEHRHGERRGGQQRVEQGDATEALGRESHHAGGLDQDRRPVGELLEHLEVAGPEPARLVRHDEGHRADGLAVRPERHRGDRGDAELAPDLARPGVRSELLEQDVVDRVEHLAAASLDEGQTLGAELAEVVGRVPVELADQFELARVTMARRQLADRALVREEVDRAPVGDARDEQLEQVDQRTIGVVVRDEQFRHHADECSGVAERRHVGIGAELRKNSRRNVAALTH